MYKELIQNGPFSEIAPQAQLNIGTARENKKDFAGAVVAYETAADKYSDLEGIAEDALFRAGEALQKEAKEAEYDQSVASRAIEVFNEMTESIKRTPTFESFAWNRPVAASKSPATTIKSISIEGP
jgi:outer membrane protein assembly factor BamD (BamD/ComL family)